MDSCKALSVVHPQDEPFSLPAAIGNTPLVALHHLNPNPAVRLLAKLEGNNPGGSVKDRTAWWMIRQAEADGLLTPEKTILEPTSGNTGIALAMLAAARGYRIRLVMPECVSLERRAVLEAYGAELVLSPACEATDGAIRLAHRILAEEPERYFMPNQYDNPANPAVHFETTGPEIWRQTAGSVDVFVAGMGTSGTLMGVGRYLRDAEANRADCRHRTAARSQGAGAEEHAGSDRAGDLPGGGTRPQADRRG